MKKTKIYVDIGIVDPSDLSPDKVPDDFWGKLAWNERYAAKPLEIQFYKNTGDILRRIAQKCDIPVLLELPERKDSQRGFTGISCSDFVIHTTDKEKFQRIAASLPDYRVGYFSTETEDCPFFKSKDFPRGCEDFFRLKTAITFPSAVPCLTVSAITKNP